MTKTQRKRAAYNYRYYYFKKNPGLFGKIWFCSQCHKILWGKENVQVDHIWALGAGGVNRTFNTVAICKRCNSLKSDKTGLWLINGMIGKLIEVIIFRTRSVVKFFVLLPGKMAGMLARVVGGGLAIVILLIVILLCYRYFM